MYTTDVPHTSRLASTEMFFVVVDVVVGREWGGRLLSFGAFRVGAYSKVGG